MQNLHKDLVELNWINANHSGILKKVCFHSEEFVSNITQIAYTELKQGVEIVDHTHISMEEVFFLLEGICEFKIQGKVILAKENSVIRIPVNQEHSLCAISDCRLFYFGVSI